MRMDGKGGDVDRPRSFDDLALRIDSDEVGDADSVKAQPEWIDPERVRLLGIASRDVTSDAFGEAERGEDAEASGEPLLAAASLLFKSSGFRRPKAAKIGAKASCLVRSFAVPAEVTGDSSCIGVSLSSSFWRTHPRA
jgi:hypothetical protein